MRFRMDLFDKIRVLGQVDKKFIAVVAKDLNISNGTTSKDILLLFDQHAVHERIRLEKLISGEFIFWIYLSRPKLFLSLPVQL